MVIETGSCFFLHGTLVSFVAYTLEVDCHGNRHVRP